MFTQSLSIVGAESTSEEPDQDQTRIRPGSDQDQTRISMVQDQTRVESCFIGPQPESSVARQIFNIAVIPESCDCSVMRSEVTCFSFFLFALA